MNVEFTPKAYRELADIYSGLKAQSPQGAAAVILRIEHLLAALATQPRMGVKAGSRGLRRVTAQPYPYLVFYRAGRERIVVIGVRHAARDPSTMPDAGS